MSVEYIIDNITMIDSLTGADIYIYLRMIYDAVTNTQVK